MSPDTVETLLREEVRRRRVEQFFAAADALANDGTPPRTQEEIEKEIGAAHERDVARIP